MADACGHVDTAAEVTVVFRLRRLPRPDHASVGPTLPARALYHDPALRAPTRTECRAMRRC